MVAMPNRLYFKCRTIKPEGTPSAIYGHSFMADLLWAVEYWV